MSWLRIVRFAKSRHIPVIITDETGEDPLILVSLDELEQALDGALPEAPVPTPVPRTPTPSFVPEEVVEEVPAIITEPVPAPVVPAPPKAHLPLEESAVIPTVATGGTQPIHQNEAEIVVPPQPTDLTLSLEERFFLEY